MHCLVVVVYHTRISVPIEWFPTSKIMLPLGKRICSCTRIRKSLPKSKSIDNGVCKICVAPSKSLIVTKERPAQGYRLCLRSMDIDDLLITRNNVQSIICERDRRLSGQVSMTA